MSNFKSKQPHQAYVRDVYLAYLINGARRTKTEGYPIIEGWMVSDTPPDDILQWDRRNEIKDVANTAISFYCVDSTLTPILNNPAKYVDKLRSFHSVIGMDASPYDNMPPVVQKSQIFCNLAITYFYGTCGLKVIPNVRLGTEVTYDSLEAYPKNQLIAIGTNGFTKSLKNRVVFKEQIDLVVESLVPQGIIVYGPTPDELFSAAKVKEVPVYQYDSYMMKRNNKRKEENK